MELNNYFRPITGFIISEQNTALYYMWINYICHVYILVFMSSGRHEYYQKAIFLRFSVKRPMLRWCTRTVSTVIYMQEMNLYSLIVMW